MIRRCSSASRWRSSASFLRRCLLGLSEQPFLLALSSLLLLHDPSLLIRQSLALLGLFPQALSLLSHMLQRLFLPQGSELHRRISSRSLLGGHLSYPEPPLQLEDRVDDERLLRGPQSCLRRLGLLLRSQCGEPLLFL